jgi:rubrerythrin
MKFTADHALQIAIEMEQLGRTFYEALADGCGDSRIETFARKLAEEEGTHIRVFEQMRDGLPPGLRGPRTSEKELFLAAKELSNKILPNPEKVRETVLSSDLGKALGMAIEMEKEAVSYYLSLVSDAPDLDVAVLTNVANEEKKHLRALNKHRLLYHA